MMAMNVLVFAQPLAIVSSLLGMLGPVVYYGDGHDGFVIVGRSVDEVFRACIESTLGMVLGGGGGPIITAGTTTTATSSNPTGTRSDGDTLVVMTAEDHDKMAEKDRLIEILTQRLAGVGEGSSSSSSSSSSSKVVTLDEARTVMKAAAVRLQEGDESAQNEFDR